MAIEWTKIEEQFILDNADRMTDAELTTKLTRATGKNYSLEAVRKKRQRMKIKKKPGRGVCKLLEPSTHHKMDPDRLAKELVAEKSILQELEQV